jgi:hypothetical protein
MRRIWAALPFERRMRIDLKAHPSFSSQSFHRFESNEDWTVGNDLQESANDHHQSSPFVTISEALAEFL